MNVTSLRQSRGSIWIPFRGHLRDHLWDPLFPDLQWDSMKQAMSAVRDKALIRQNLLTLSADATTIIKVVPPEYDHYFFKNIEPEYKEMIFNIYKNNN